jgi:hypothetical protein
LREDISDIKFLPDDPEQIHEIMSAGECDESTAGELLHRLSRTQEKVERELRKLSTEDRATIGRND